METNDELVLTEAQQQVLNDKWIKEKTDQELLELFKDIEAVGVHVFLIPPVVQKVTKGGILRGEDEIKKEEAELSGKPVLVLSVGSEVKYFKPGDKVYVGESAHRAFFTDEREGYRAVCLAWNYIVAKDNS